MKILYITSSFDKKGSASIRNIALVNGLVQNSCEVDVLTQDWPKNMCDSSLTSYIDENIHVYKDEIKVITKYFSEKTGSTNNDNNVYRLKSLLRRFRRIIQKLVFFPDIDKEWIKNYNKKLSYANYDLIISSSDTKTAHFVGKKISHKYGVKWVQIWGDPWEDDITLNCIEKIRAKNSERRLINSCDYVFYVSLPTLQSMQQKYPNNSKLNFIARSFMRKLVSKENNKNDSINIFYPGSIYYGRNAQPLIQSINSYNSIHKEKILLNVHGNHEVNTKKLCGENVVFHNYINFHEVEERMKQADVLLVLLNDKRSNQIPGKLFDYFATNKPILVVTDDIDNDVTKYIKSLNRCIIIDNNSDISLDSMVSRFKKEYEILEQFSSVNVARELLNKI